MYVCAVDTEYMYMSACTHTYVHTHRWYLLIQMHPTLYLVDTVQELEEYG